MKNPTVAILVIGSEVLSGRIADVNVNYICRRCADLGLDVAEVRMVRDEEAAIVTAVNALRAAHTYVFTTGGIGPTHDDMTIASIAKAFGVAVQRNLQVEQQLRDHYGSRVTPAALRMADYPAGARIVPHGESFAPSCFMENVAILAGQPRIMQLMFEATVPLLQTGTPLHTRQVDGWGMESQIAERLGILQSRFAGVEIGSYPYRVEGRAGTALVCRGPEAGAVEASFAAVQELVTEAGMEVRG
jgi:molybdenum cofactor synthesis domain-containing protein